MRILTTAFVVLALATFAASGADNTLGTWKLNVEKSKYTPAPVPVKTLTIVREVSDGGVKVTTTGERADGTPINVTYTTRYGGSPSSVTGANPLYDTISVKQIDANTLTDERRKNGGSYKATGRTEISDEGRTMTMTTKGVDANGKDFVGVLVLEKQ